MLALGILRKLKSNARSDNEEMTEPCVAFLIREAILTKS